MDEAAAALVKPRFPTSLPGLTRPPDLREGRFVVDSDPLPDASEVRSGDSQGL